MKGKTMTATTTRLCKNKDNRYAACADFLELTASMFMEYSAGLHAAREEGTKSAMSKFVHARKAMFSDYDERVGELHAFRKKCPKTTRGKWVPAESALPDMLLALSRMKGVDVTMEPSASGKTLLLVAHGNTYGNRRKLKDLGMRYSGKARSWVWSDAMS